MLLKLKHYADLSFWKRRHHHCSSPNALLGCALTATTGLNVAKRDIGVNLGGIWSTEWLGVKLSAGPIHPGKRQKEIRIYLSHRELPMCS